MSRLRQQQQDETEAFHQQIKGTVRNSLYVLFCKIAMLYLCDGFPQNHGFLGLFSKRGSSLDSAALHLYA